MRLLAVTCSFLLIFSCGVEKSIEVNIEYDPSQMVIDLDSFQMIEGDQLSIPVPHFWKFDSTFLEVQDNGIAYFKTDTCRNIISRFYVVNNFFVAPDSVNPHEYYASFFLNETADIGEILSNKFQLINWKERSAMLGETVLSREKRIERVLSCFIFIDEEFLEFVYISDSSCNDTDIFYKSVFNTKKRDRYLVPYEEEPESIELFGY